MEQSSKRRKAGIFPVVIILVILCVFLGFRFLRGAESSAITISNVDLSQIPDGSYAGKAKNSVVRAEVIVMVDDGMVMEIDLTKHFTGKGRPAEAIIDEVIAKQSLDVDAVSGATLSSNAILMAIDNALSSDAREGQ